MAGLLSRYFGFRERSTDLATEVRAGFTTFMVMAHRYLSRGGPALDQRSGACAAFVVYFCMPLIEGAVK